MRDAWITVGFSAHRVESLPAAREAMQGHGAIVLEEPVTAGFEAMLEGRLGVDEHLEQLAPEFPEYSLRQCAMLRELHADGVRIVQSDPFMSELEAIHEHFDSGGNPEDFISGTVRHRVYQSEKRCFGALLTYYAVSAGDSMERAVDAVCAFARMDAARGELRDAMRARQIAAKLSAEGGLYVEAGFIHVGLLRQLRRHVSTRVAIRPRWLTGEQMRAHTGRAAVFSPGDRLTIAYARGHAVDDHRARLLAAQSLFQVAISAKEELIPSESSPYPHAVDDAETSALVTRLTYADCRDLFSLLRTESRGALLQAVRRRATAS